MANLELHGIEKHYAAFHALRGIDLAVEPGEFIVMVGPSGCGKSTLLKTIAGLESPSAGRIEIGGRDVTDLEPSDRGIAMVFQSYALYPHMTVGENMGFGLRLAKRPKEEIAAAVANAAQILRLEEQLEKLPRQLSGGQRQRVAIGRAITRAPEVFLFDEPLSNLDASLRTQMRVELSTLHARLGATMIYVTHDQVEAMTMADRIVVLNAGIIEQVGAPLELYGNPANQFVAGFLGAPRMNFLPVTATGQQGARVEVMAADGRRFAVEVRPGVAPAAGAALMAGIRPEHFALAPQDGSTPGFDATVKLVEHLGRETILYADAGPLKSSGSDTGTTNITVQLGSIVQMPPDSPIRLTFDPAAAYLFDADGRTISTPKAI